MFSHQLHFLLRTFLSFIPQRGASAVIICNYSERTLVPYFSGIRKSLQFRTQVCTGEGMGNHIHQMEILKLCVLQKLHVKPL